MNKLRFTFHFADEPQYRVAESRAHVAHLLRAYRANPDRYQLTRVGAHLYTIRNRYPRMSAVAIIEAQS